MTKKQFVPISGPYMAAEELICDRLPDLLIGEEKVETVANRPTTTYMYVGDLGKWGDLPFEVAKWYNSSRHLFDRVDSIPVSMHPDILEENADAMLEEHIKVGAEITLSARFMHNALASVTAALKTMVKGEPSAPEFVHLQNQEFPFGDAWTNPRPQRVKGLYPDVIFLLGALGAFQVRYFGEIKSFIVRIEDMTHEASFKPPKELREVLGQIVNYMRAHRLKYAFLSNYKYTVFLKVDAPEHSPTTSNIYFSKPIPHDQTTNCENEDDPQLSIRLVMLWLTLKCCSNDDKVWRITPEEAAQLEAKVTRTKVSGPVNSLVTPSDARTSRNPQLLAQQRAPPRTGAGTGLFSNVSRIAPFGMSPLSRPAANIEDITFDFHRTGLGTTGSLDPASPTSHQNGISRPLGTGRRHVSGYSTGHDDPLITSSAANQQQHRYNTRSRGPPESDQTVEDEKESP
ncbi:hypothetical protein M011DRAFT_483427 [Sporormia fimetaria CBS 119925]|uniref:Uncharacterized protein n=1 Tax=Sporormia fimetaria CBS 119925 TaxID=1340428 RepID=A0A6A6VPK0_9PLEO|nr:hypothetical protein M011DRAFT_483427 [Sporormia fimetaria CBS 119925]